MKDPSERQQKAAKAIACTMGIPMPTEFTAQCYWEYISEHKEKSMEISAHRRELAHQSYALKMQLKERQDKWWQQREADWEATHLHGGIWARRILDGEVLPPSWSGRSILEEQRRLRDLGYKSSLEEKLEQLEEERSGWR